jgi:hypothetical protein
MILWPPGDMITIFAVSAVIDSLLIENGRRSVIQAIFICTIVCFRNVLKSSHFRESLDENESSSYGTG